MARYLCRGARCIETPRHVPDGCPAAPRRGLSRAVPRPGGRGSRGPLPAWIASQRSAPKSSVGAQIWVNPEDFMDGDAIHLVVRATIRRLLAGGFGGMHEAARGDVCLQACWLPDVAVARLPLAYRPPGSRDDLLFGRSRQHCSSEMPGSHKRGPSGLAFYARAGSLRVAAGGGAMPAGQPAATSDMTTL